MSKLSFLVSIAGQIAGILAAQNVGYVVDNALGQVKVVDLNQRRVTATVAVGNQASEILVLPNNRTALVANQADNTVSLLDLTTNTPAATIAVGQAPGDMIASGDGRFLYVANQGSNDITVIDVAARAVVAAVPVDTTPVQVNLSPDGRYVYAVNHDALPSGTVSVIDASRNQIVTTMAVGLQPVQFAISPSLTTAYVINSGSGSVSAIDLSRNEVTATIPVGQGPSSAAFSTDGRFLYVVNRDSNSVSVIDTQQDREVTRIPVGTQPVDMVVTFDSKFGYVSNQGSNSVSVLDLTYNTNESTISVGSGPFDVNLDPNENFLYVTNIGSQSVSVVDVNTDRVVATIPIGGAPVQFSFLNPPTLLELAPNPAPAGSRIVLNGEGFLPTSTVRVIATSGTTTVRPVFLDSEGVQITLPAFPGQNAAIVLDNPDGNSSETLAFRIGSPGPSIFSGGVVEDAGFHAAPYPISEGAVVAVFGAFPGLDGQQAPGFPLPTRLEGARVTFNGVPAPLYFVRSDVIDAVAPATLPQPTARVAVTVRGETSAVEPVNTAPTSPGIFMIDSNATAAARHGLRPLDIVTAADPAERGEIIVLYVTGLGTTDPPQFPGWAARDDMLSSTPVTPVVTIGDTVAQVLFSGLTPGSSGLYQINLVVPDSAPSGNVAVTVTTGALTSNPARITVK